MNNSFKWLEPHMTHHYALADRVEDARAVIMKCRTMQPETEA
jgi:hypothetical protein